MAKCSVFVGTSLDGYIARADGSIDWLEETSASLPGEDYGFERFLSSVDAIVMGRNTFEQVVGFSSWPYGDTPLIVLSRTLRALPPNAPASVSLSDESPADLVDRLANAGFPHLYIDGGLTIQSFMGAGLIDEVTITVLPIVLGSGKPLFGPLSADVKLELVSSEAYDSGLVQSRYRVLRDEPDGDDA